MIINLFYLFQVLCALSFYATGSYQRAVGMGKHVGQTTISKYVTEVTNALTCPDLVNSHIHFPTTTQERIDTKKKVGILTYLFFMPPKHVRFLEILT